MLLGVGIAIASVSGWVAASSATAHPLPTQPQRIPGVEKASTSTTLEVVGGDLKLSALRNALGSKATATRVGGRIRVTGASKGQLAAAVHGLIGGKGASITTQGHSARTKRLTGREVNRLKAINEGMVAYGLSRNFGQGFDDAGDGEQSRVQRSVYPVPRCTRMECASCGDPPEAGLDCSDLKRTRDDALDELSEHEAKVAIWQAALQAHKDMAFYGGIAGMIGDMVSAASTVLSAGTATGASRAAARLLIQMARDGALEALMEELGIPGLADMTEAMVEEQLSQAETARVAAAAAYDAAHQAWVECMNNPASMSPAELAQHRKELGAWNRCRYNVYMGLAPQCQLVEFPCP
ncbi:MAG: hypothetical protein AAF799_33850 [Myxococcota bacterium]